MTTIPTRGLASDTQSTASLRGLAASDPKAAVKEVSRQFEALFMQELMKSMRQATPTSGMLDNSGSELGTEMLDAEYARSMTGRPNGLADAIARQLERSMGLARPPANGSANGAALQAYRDAAGPATDASRDGGSDDGSMRLAMAMPSTAQWAAQRQAATASAQSAYEASAAAARGVTGAQAFVERHQEAARSVERETGIPATFMLAQSALETGWGKRDIRARDGTPSNNLFGIKAGPGWKGRVAEVTTTEFVNGQARKVTARFRAYDTVEDSFADYARLMKDSPRYAKVASASATPRGFAQSLQRAGYATDPAYADKLTRVIATTERLQRSMTVAVARPDAG